MKIRERGKNNKYLDLAKGLKELWNVIVIPILVGALGTAPKKPEKATINNFTLSIIGIFIRCLIGSHMTVTETPFRPLLIVSDSARE